jgi:hypothetical protein
MKIKTFGCSLTHGTDLEYVTHELDVSGTTEPTRPTWPALLAQHFRLPYETHAWPGIGNLRICERVLFQAKLKDPAIFVINWSWTDRFDYLEPEQEKWETLLPTGHAQRNKLYYKNFYNQSHAVFNNLCWIHAALSVLLEKNIPFYMTAIDPVLFHNTDSTWQDTLAVSLLQQRIKNHINWFDGLDFLSWSRKNNFPVSKNWHPLETAHKAAADYVIKVFDTQKIIDQARQVHV